MLFYMNWYEGNASLDLEKHCLFPNSYIIIYLCLITRKKRNGVLYDFKNWNDKKTKKRTSSQFFTSFEGFDWTEIV